MSDGIQCECHVKRQNGVWFFIVKAPDWVIDDMESQSQHMTVKFMDINGFHGTMRKIQIVPDEEEPHDPR